MARKFSDKCTVVSIYPRDLSEFKPGIYPSDYFIPAGQNNIPSLTIISPAISYNHNYLVSPPQVTTNYHPAIEVAKSIVDDFKNSTFTFDDNSLYAGAHPGLMFLPGEWTLDDILDDKEAKKMLDELIAKQQAWFKGICELATNLWNKTKQAQAISDIQRVAARILGMDVEWLIENQFRTVRCPACQNFLQPESVVCGNCRCVIDKEKFAKLQFAEV